MGVNGPGVDAGEISSLMLDVRYCGSEGCRADEGVFEAELAGLKRSDNSPSDAGSEAGSCWSDAEPAGPWVEFRIDHLSSSFRSGMLI